MAEISLDPEEVLIVLAALDDYEQEMSDQGQPEALADTSALYARFDSLRCST